MKISIITATYNSSKHISKVLDCIQKQTQSDIEYIVIDGGSTDGTLDILRNSEMISHLVSEQDKGIYDALNKGINLVSGDIIGFLHSDDLLATPDILEKIVRAFEPDASGLRVDGVYGDLVYVDKKDITKIIRYWRSSPIHSNSLQYGWMPAHPSLFLHREVYEKHGLFDLSFRISADYDLMLRIFKDTSLNFVYFPEVITKMRVGGMSNGSLKNIIHKSKEDFKALKKNNIPHPLWALFLKNISKIHQFWLR